MTQIMESLRSPQDLFRDDRLRRAQRTDYLLDDTGLPKSNVISFRLSDEDRFVVRPSGTEPKMKAYLFTRASSPAEAEKRLDSLRSLVDSICGT